MSKMKVVSKKKVEELILKEVGQTYCAEDKYYRLLPESFFTMSLLQKILGLPEWVYVTEGFDCDNFADNFRYQLKRKYWKKHVREIKQDHGSESYPDVFVECVKIKYPDADAPHWIVGIICDDGNGNPKLIFRERTRELIITPKEGYDIMRIK